MWLNTKDFKMPNGLAPCFIAKYAGPYEILHKAHLDVYTLKLLAIFVAYLTFHVLKLKLFLRDEQRLDQKQRMRLKVDAIEHMLVIKIKSILVQGRHVSKAKNMW
jgi:hypothetical protein